MDRFQILKDIKSPRISRECSDTSDFLRCLVSESPEFKHVQDTFKSIKNLIDWIKKRNTEELIGEFCLPRGYLSREEFRKEFCTLHWSMPRGSGNTTLALMILHYYSNSIFITVTRDMATHLNIINRQILSIKQYESSFRGIRADAVIVDMAKYMNLRDLEKIYLIDSEIFVLIG
jgi:hypothetical protein